jgi:hypothetical protein
LTYEEESEEYDEEEYEDETIEEVVEKKDTNENIKKELPQAEDEDWD